jgi:AsmA protein
MSVPDLEGVLPAVGVTLPSGSALTTGTLDANLAIAGPTDKLVITGPIKLANGTIKGFSVSSKLGALGSFAGLGGNKSSDTVIESLTANVRVEPAGTHAQDLNVVIQGIGSVTGDANIDAAGKLDCKMVAHVSGGALGGVSQMTSVASLPFGGGGKGSSGGGGGGIPFRVTGTTSNPIFVPDVAGMAGGLAKGGAAAALGGGKALGGGAAGGAAGALGGLLGKKK